MFASRIKKRAIVSMKVRTSPNKSTTLKNYSHLQRGDILWAVWLFVGTFELVWAIKVMARTQLSFRSNRKMPLDLHLLLLPLFGDSKCTSHLASGGSKYKHSQWGQGPSTRLPLSKSQPLIWATKKRKKWWWFTKMDCTCTIALHHVQNEASHLFE